MAPPTISNEDTIALLNAKAKADGDAFRLKIFRKRAVGQMPEIVAIFEGANVAQVASPEEWLPKFAGGGPVYMIKCYHVSDVSTPIGNDLSFSISGDPHAPDASAVRSPAWKGPQTLSWFEGKDTPAVSAPTYSINPSPGGSQGVTAPQTSVPTGGTQATVSTAQDAALVAERERLARIERELDAKLRQAELDRLQMQHDSKMRELESKMLAHAKPAGPSILEIVTALGSTLGPIFTAMIQSNNETRALVMKQQMDAQQEQNKLFHALLERKTDDTPATKLMATVTDAVGSVMKLQSEAMQMISETVMGPQDPPGLKIVKEVAKAVGAIASAPKVAVPKKALPAAAMAAKKHAAAVEMREPTLDKIERLIRAYTAPNVVAQVTLQAVNDQDDVAVQEALAAVNGDLISLFQQRLGEWVLETPENANYIRQVAAELQAVIAQAEASIETQSVEETEGEDDDASEDAA